MQHSVEVMADRAEFLMAAARSISVKLPLGMTVPALERILDASFGCIPLVPDRRYHLFMVGGPDSSVVTMGNMGWFCWSLDPNGGGLRTVRGRGERKEVYHVGSVQTDGVGFPRAA